MKLYGLTGGIGMGKSTATGILEGWGVATADTDVIAREVVEPGQPALAEIADAFGSDMLDQAGRLRRDALARRVFADTEARRRLESMLHPRIREVWRTRVQAWRLAGRPVAVVVIPLLFETGAEAELDATICVACTAASQQERLQARGWTVDEIERRLRAQLPVGEKMARADFVVWTEGTLEVHARQLMRVIPQVQAGSG
jgi:dephospho-CoA kinase